SMVRFAKVSPSMIRPLESVFLVRVLVRAIPLVSPTSPLCSSGKVGKWANHPISSHSRPIGENVRKTGPFFTLGLFHSIPGVGSQLLDVRPCSVPGTVKLEHVRKERRRTSMKDRS